MFGWLGFGQKEKQSIEDKSEEILPTVELEQATTEQSVEQVTEKPVASSVESESVEHVSAEISEPVSEEVAVVEAITEEPVVEEVVQLTETDVLAEVLPDVVPAVLPVENLLTEMESAEQEQPTEVVDEVAKEAKSEAEKKLAEPVTEVKAEKLGFFARLKQGLSKTRQSLGGGLVDLFRGKQIDDDLFEELETHLLLADVGVETTMKIIDSLTQSASRKELKDASALYDLLKAELKKIIEPASQPLVIPEGEGPFVMLMVGVNGVGKTTTIGKLAKQFQAQGKSVMLAAGDTFRAAAVEQLQVWGERNDIPVIAQHTGADSASVIFDAINAAKSRNVDVIIADTAGRLQNKAHLMEELKKVVRVMKKLDVNAPHEVMLTLDAGTGQNALSQTKLFDEAVGLTGLTVTKLDGTAKGGVVFAIADKHNIPIRYLGVGEGIDDLRPFNADDFIEAIFSN